MKRSGRLGAAYYDPFKATLYLLEDTADSTHFDLTHMRKCFLSVYFLLFLTYYFGKVIEQASPEVIITSSKSDDRFIEAVRAKSMRFSPSC